MMTLLEQNRETSALIIENQFVAQLPGDTQTAKRPREVLNACYSIVSPLTVPEPELVAYSRETAQLLGFSDAFCRSERFLQAFSGNRLLKGMIPYATCYGGHQFGTWAGQLGDGRAINLGEITHPLEGKQVLQLKGAGPTPYSRTADGLAVLRSSIREFLCSEAMFHLGIPTTRALSLILTGELVERDMFYDGHPRLEPGAVVCRVSPSFTRFGSFEIFAARNDISTLKTLADFTIQNDFKHLLSASSPGKAEYIKWFDAICRLTAEMMVHWMRTGFVHGVMNTDNMSILGLTIDYGPYGWLEDYDPAWTPNTTDARTRRYCFANQPKIAQWNLAQLANAIYPLVEDAAPLQEAVNEFWIRFETDWTEMMLQKIGVSAQEKNRDAQLVSDLMALLPMVEIDYTLFFRHLARLDIPAFEQNKINIQAFEAPLKPAFYQPEQRTPAFDDTFHRWLTQYASRVHDQGGSMDQRRKQMNRTNPKYILRNYLAQMAIEKAEQGDFSLVGELLDLVRHPYDEQPGKESYADKRPDWARTKPGCSMLSCSS